MRFLIDENMSPVIAALLRNAGHDVIAVGVESPRLPDPDVMAWAARENRMLATFDTDFGELIFSLGLPSPPAVVLFRLSDTLAPDPIEVVVNTLLEERAWEGFFWVVETNGVRQRRLPDR